jgi:hypothetical protein
MKKWHWYEMLIALVLGYIMRMVWPFSVMLIIGCIIFYVLMFGLRWLFGG